MGLSFSDLLWSVIARVIPSPTLTTTTNDKVENGFEGFCAFPQNDKRFWIATGRQRAPRNDDNNKEENDNGILNTPPFGHPSDFVLTVKGEWLRMRLRIKSAMTTP
jgi:hypothetical protein